MISCNSPNEYCSTIFRVVTAVQKLLLLIIFSIILLILWCCKKLKLLWLTASFNFPIRALDHPFQRRSCVKTNQKVWEFGSFPKWKWLGWHFWKLLSFENDPAAYAILRVLTCCLIIINRLVVSRNAWKRKKVWNGVDLSCEKASIELLKKSWLCC